MSGFSGDVFVYVRLCRCSEELFIGTVFVIEIKGGKMNDRN